MRDSLLTAGFKQIEHDEYLHPNAFRVYQKCVRGQGSKLYFITVYEYHAHPNQLDNPFEAVGQFNTEEALTFNLTLLDGWKVEEMEAFFSDLFVHMGCIPYDG